MDTTPNTSDIDAALANCAAEPVHIPGLVQPFACLIGLDATSELIQYASENCRDIIGVSAGALLGSKASELFDTEFLHALGNEASQSGFTRQLSHIGRFQVQGSLVEVSCFGSDRIRVLQIEPPKKASLGGQNGLATLSYLMGKIESCADQKSLFSLTTQLLRHLTGFDRVMIYKFDPDWNGAVVAETLHTGLDPYLGLHFPKWDIPEQARAIMAKLPLRFIEDVDQPPSPLMAADNTLPPLDITLAECRGVSPVHLEYLRNMGSQATLTLSVLSESKLWGIISFHHGTTRVPPRPLRDILTAFIGVFSTKLESLQNHERLLRAQSIDKMRDDALEAMDAQDTAVEVSAAGQAILDMMHAQGAAFMMESSFRKIGMTPDHSVLDRLSAEIRDHDTSILVIENLAERFPDLADGLNGCAGAIVSRDTPARQMFLFRQERAQAISWAGNPEKKIEMASGTARLNPRASFAAFLDEAGGHCEAWTSEDIYLADRMWSLINRAERAALRARWQQQQSLMIKELNHRVRNILSLMRSVSRQTQTRTGTLAQYSEMIEARIQALAAAHDFPTTSIDAPIALQQLMGIVGAPYVAGGNIEITGPESYLRGDCAPLFSLIMHELATNAAKYGALSVPEGKVDITVTKVEGGVSFAWRERGGPKVVQSNHRGFGSDLIEKAIPHEMSGKASLRLKETGLEADFFLPDEVFVAEPKVAAMALETPYVQVPDIDATAFEGTLLLLEDNFAIASDLKEQLEEFGFPDIALCGNKADALAAISSQNPRFAILDVNLGFGDTSEDVAHLLVRLKIPFIFLSGYGEDFSFAAAFRDIPCFTKPVAPADLKRAIAAATRELD